MFCYSRDRTGEYPQAHLAGYAGLFQANAFGGYTKLYEPNRRPGPVLEAACWVHARWPFFAMADLSENARRTVQGRTPGVISPLALEVVRRIDALLKIERSINSQRADQRRAVRQDVSARLVVELEGLVARAARQFSRGNELAKAMDYMLKRCRPSCASSMTAASASRTIPRNAPCAASLSAGSHGCSPGPTAAASAPRPCTA